MSKNVEKYLPKALEAVRCYLVLTNGDQTTSNVNEEYDGYTASFGASVITAGLLPTLSFYTNIHKRDSNTEVERNKPQRYKILKAIAFILREHAYGSISDLNTGLLDFSIIPVNNTKALKRDILDASIALKLALRNFKHIKSTTRP